MTITINGTTGIAGVDGTASVPAFKGNDADTGIYYPTANEVAAAAGGSSVWNASSTFGYKNRLINGGMMIDQRNAGASVSLTSTAGFPVDRFRVTASSTTLTVQRSTAAPAGFVNSLQVTNGTGAAPSATLFNGFVQQIEGNNIADLGFGAASAQTITLSFWVRSSITGTYAGRLTNGSDTRVYLFTYTINAANTWEFKTVTIPGDTTGTWATDNSLGLQVLWDLGSGSNFNGTPGSWGTSNVTRTSGSVTWVATTGATFQITGVQLERGSVATSFDFRPYGTELALCQRYYQRLDMNDGAGLVGMAGSSTFGLVQYPLPVVMRAAPSALGTTGNASDYRFRYGGATFTLASAVPALVSATASLVRIDTNVASGLTAGNVVVLSGAAASSVFLTFSAEL